MGNGMNDLSASGSGPVPRAAGEIWYLSFEPPQDLGTGLATYLRNVARAAQSVERNVRIFYLAKGAKESTRRTEGYVTYVAVPDAMTKEREPIGYWMNVSWALADQVCKEIAEFGKPAGIEIPDGFGAGCYLLQRKLTGDARLRDIPVFLLAHTPIRFIDEWNEMDVHKLPNWWTFRAEQWCYKATDAVITLSTMLEDKLRTANYIGETQIVRRGFNPFIRETARASAVTKPEVLTVGMASRMVNWKGLREALSLAREADRSGLSMKLELCGGSTPDFDKARNDFAGVFQSGTASYTGMLSEQDLAARRLTWSCQIHPSLYDNFPYAVLECLASGLPCLISERNGIAEVLEPDLRKLLVCDFTKPKEVVAALKSLPSAEDRLRTLNLPCFSALDYFRFRDDLIDELTRGPGKGARFPFIQADQSIGGLRPTAKIPASPAGARITVVVPYFNMGKYIDDCTKSVLGSSVKAEVIIVNDGSTDPASVAKLDEYRSHERVRVFDIPNGGVARARNFGVAQANTEFVALLDADDSVQESYYKKAIHVLDAYDNVGFVGCWSNDYSDETQETLRYWPTYNAEPLPNIMMNNTNCQALIYRRELYNKAGQHDPALKMFLDDWDGMLGMLEHGYFGVMLPEPLFNYRQRKGSIFSSNRAAWDVNFAYMVRKRQNLYSRNWEEALLFSNANGPNRSFHLLGWHTPANLTDPPPSRFKSRLVSIWDKLPKPVQKAIMPFADFIDRAIK
jgi:glycogen(starch) synthase